jgi:RHS repeat-associated protein
VLGWDYDRYGNRWDQNATGNGSAVQAHFSFSGNNNRIDSDSYDADGNLLNDGTKSYSYDAENRIVAVNGQATYIYDAEGTRVAKLGAGGVITAMYILDAGNRQLTEINGSGQWQHTNVYASGGRLLATYTPSTGSYHYNLTDWLGTKRMQTTANGNVEETCVSYPYGDGLSCVGSADATEQHFTGKERDAESGNDYFGARYYASSMGRWMSPDWAKTPEGVPYADLSNPQSLNLYEYVGNNPLSRFDPDGHDGLWDLAKKWLNVVEVKVGASAGVGASGQWGVAKGEAHATLIGVEAKTGLGGAGADAKVVSGVGASGSAGPAKAGVNAGGEISVKDGASANASANASVGPMQASASASVDSAGGHTSASATVSGPEAKDDTKVAGSLTVGVTVGVGLNLSQAGRAWDSTMDGFRSLGNLLTTPATNNGQQVPYSGILSPPQP